MIPCDYCGQTATTHIVLAINGIPHDCHFCDVHAANPDAPRAKLPDKMMGEMAVSMILPQLKATAALMRRLGRMPSPDELGVEMGTPRERAGQLPADAFVRRQLEYVESLAGYMESHGRMPADESEFPFSQYADLGDGPRP